MMETEPIITSLSNVLNKQSAHKHTAFFGSFGRPATTPNEWHLEDQEVSQGTCTILLLTWSLASDQSRFDEHL